MADYVDEFVGTAGQALTAYSANWAVVDVYLNDPAYFGIHSAGFAAPLFGTTTQVSVFRNTQTVGVDQYTGIKIANATDTVAELYAAGRISGSGATASYYAVRVADDSAVASPAKLVSVVKVTNRSTVQVLASTTVSGVDGDEFVLRLTGTAPVAYEVRKNGVAIGALTGTDSASPFTAGPIGLGGKDPGGLRIDRWVGGDLGASDTTAPTLSSPTGTGGTLAATGTVNTNEGTGTLYYLVSTNSTETVPAQGQPMTGWSSQAVTTTGAQNVSATGLAAGTRYLHYVHDDAAGNRSARASSASFTVAGSGTTYSLVLSRVANNTGAGKKVSTTFTGTLVYGGHFDSLAGKTLHAITTTGVNADGDATLTGLPQTGAAMLLRRWADGALSVEFVTVA